MDISALLLQKYNVPVPRYTSYPTVPYWDNMIDTSSWKNEFRQQFEKNNAAEGISLYLHLPFCESLCTYCGCNKKITRNHNVEKEYAAAILKEWKLYRDLMQTTPVIRELHLGGGTPTFYSPANLKELLGELLKDAVIHPQHEFSFEGHPNNTTKEHLEVLYSMGFRRVSYGVQDNDPDVQRVINRVQPIENVMNAVDNARSVGFKSVNFDLIYGLPLQTETSMEKTILECIALKPDRVAFYSYAHVPWASRGQRLFDENDLPDAGLKMKLYTLGKKLFAQNGYEDIGMDHFALPHDDLYKAWKDGSLHRNFMGYTTQKTNMLIGLGVSAISDAGTAFAQNYKTLHDYYAAVNDDKIPVTRGYFLSEEDMLFRQHILDISCNGKTEFAESNRNLLSAYVFPELKKLVEDGLIIYNARRLVVTETGRHFTRNICRAFDLHLLRSAEKNESKMFSNAV